MSSLDTSTKVRMETEVGKKTFWEIDTVKERLCWIDRKDVRLVAWFQNVKICIQFPNHGANLDKKLEITTFANFEPWKTRQRLPCRYATRPR